MKIYIVKKNILFLITIFTLCAFLLSLGENSTIYANVFFGNNLKLYPIYKVDTLKKDVAITFDAAWGADKTIEIMNVCDEFNIKATFFLVGIWIEEYEEETKAIYERGFEIGSHSYNHPDMTKLDKQAKQTELIKTSELIYSKVGIKPKVFRAPYGAYNNELISCVSELGMQGIQWDVDTLDWKGYGPNQVIARVRDKVDCGSIILCHNNADYVIENTRLILTTLQNQGYNFVTVSELIKEVKEVKLGIGKI